MREIEERYAEPWSMAALAEIAGVHPVHLARAFRRSTGKTVGQYFRELRIRHACEELRSTSHSIEEIALRAGFTDPSHLSRWIRRTTGLSPRDIRRFARPKR
jgi:AraC family transcriptional regulator